LKKLATFQNGSTPFYVFNTLLKNSILIIWSTNQNFFAPLQKVKLHYLFDSTSKLKRFSNIDFIFD